MIGFFHSIFHPATLVLMIPIVAIVCSFAHKNTKLRLEHEERLAKIEAGMDPDA